MNLTEIKQICADNGIAPTKSRGQNFLFDENVIAKIIKSANLSKKDSVLEIGPGFGVLTTDLLSSAGQVIAVELDKKIVAFLSRKYKKAENFQLIEGDILRLHINELDLPEKYKIVANLPYNITSNFIRRFLEAENKPDEMVIMVQKEVAQRMVEKPGKMSMLAVAVQFYADPEILFEVSRRSFWPAPKVDSAIIRIKLDKQDSDIDAKEFFKVVKMGFSAKRKQLQNNLSGGLQLSKEEVKDILDRLGLDEKIRAQDLSVEDWKRLVRGL